MGSTRGCGRGGCEPERKGGSGTRAAPWLHQPPTPPAEGGRPRLGAAGPAARAPAPGFPTSGRSSLRGVVPAANLPAFGPPRGPAVAATPAGTPAGRPEALPLASPRSQRPPQPGTPNLPPTAPRRAGGCASCLPAARDPQTFGGRAPPLALLGALAWALPARNRFVRDLLPSSRVPAKAGEGENLPPPTLMPTGIRSFLCVRSFPDQGFPHPSWQEPQSLVPVDPFPQAPSRQLVKGWPLASAGGDGRCGLGPLNLRNQTT